MPALTLQELQPLLDQFTGEGTVLSCYADLGVTDGFRPNWRAAFQAGADALWKGMGGDGRARQELDENATAVRQALESPTGHGARWAAVFSAVRRRFFKLIPLDEPVESDLVLDRSPYLVPLLKAGLERREYLAVHTNTHRGRVYTATPGRVRLLAELDEDVPRKQHSAGETWGYGQATIARHREDRIAHYRKALLGELERLWDAGGYAGLVLMGEHEVLEGVRRVIPKRLADRIVREAPGPWSEHPAGAEETIRGLVRAADGEERARVAPGFWDLLREGRAVATGPRAVIDAVQGGRIGPDGYGYLVFGPDPRETAGRCSVCRWLTPEGSGPCPRCQAACVPGNLWEELLLTAFRHRIAARFVEGREKLGLYGGVVAVLPKDGGPR